DVRFPSATLKEEITELVFIFGYLRKVVGKLTYYIRNQNWVRPFSTLRFSAYDVSGEDIEEFIETGIASRPLIQQLLKSVVVVVLVDCSKMTTEIDKRARKDYAEALLRVFVPQTLSQIRGGKIAGVSMDKAAYFLSWVRTEQHEGMEPVGQPRIVRTGFAPEGGGEPDFSYDEYVEFI